MLISTLKRHPIVGSVFVLTLALTLFFAVRLLFFSLYWADSEHRNLTPQPWMTPRYIAHSWGLNPNDVARAVGLNETPGKRPTLERIARDRGVPIEVVIDQVNEYLRKQPNQP